MPFISGALGKNEYRRILTLHSLIAMREFICPQPLGGILLFN
jgi:hypothetical protein